MQKVKSKRNTEIQGGAKNGASLSHCKYSENSMTELRGNWWTSAIVYAEQSLTFLFKKFIALWRHLAKTQHDGDGGDGNGDDVCCVSLSSV